MAYEPYVSPDYYKNIYKGNTVPDESLETALKTASRHIDSLTYNRIVGRGISALTEFQQEIIQEVCCEMADFEYDNAELIDSVLQSYSINGVSMDFGNSWNVKVVSGIAVRSDTYQKLQQTGLCCPVLRGWW